MRFRHESISHKRDRTTRTLRSGVAAVLGDVSSRIATIPDRNLCPALRAFFGRGS
jgi:hypothetical protein